MRNKILIAVFVSLTWVACGQKKSEKTKSSDYYAMIAPKFEGNLAYQTVAYVEKYWRIVGNAGFDSSIYKVTDGLEKAGYVLESEAGPKDRLVYRIEKRKMDKPTWEPVSSKLTIVGENEPLLESSTNRNMIMINSYSTPASGFEGEVVYIEDLQALKDQDLSGKIVYAKIHPYLVYKAAVQEGGATGIIVYNNPDYLQPEKNKTSIQFRGIPLDSLNKPWGIALSYEAMQHLDDKLAAGPVKLHVDVSTKIYESEELTVVANVVGSENPSERLVISSHVQEPGANDNATGVGVNLEMASVTADLMKEGKFDPKRTITFLWGDEIVSTNRYVQEDPKRAENIKWGISLDMVGENTSVTGGSFLIEKMPDPSAIWTRGKDEHTEWGATEMTLEDMKPHYLNDFVINRFKEQGERANWQVKANPFEGGSDHVPFLKDNIPGVLFWHFTDQFYHTDNDRLDKVSKETMKNVGTAALVSAYTLVNADATTAKAIIDEVKTSALQRLEEELKQSKQAIEQGATKASQIEIIKAWEDWYVKALATCDDMVSDSKEVEGDIKNAQQAVTKKSAACLEQL